MQVARARELVPGATFVCADMSNLEFPAARFSAIVCLFALIHLPLTEQPVILRAIVTWLRPGGIFVATVGRQAWTGVEKDWLGFEGGDMWWSHADTDTYRRWLADAGLTLELEHYQGGVPLARADEVELVHPRTFDDVRQRLVRRASLRGHARFNGSFASLLSWARREAYFFGERNRIRERMTWKIRNEEIHSEFNYVFMPPDALRRLALVSEMIARLWGSEMSTGIAYPGTIARELMVVGHGPQYMEGTQFLLEQLPHVEDDEAQGRTWFVVQSLWEEELVWWDPKIETTNTPVTRLWGPGNWDELHAAAAGDGAGWLPDTARVVDRIFYVRVINGALNHVRSAAQILALRDRSPDERWYVVRADAPADAGSHVARVLAGTCRPHGCGCAATLLFERARRETIVRHARVEFTRNLHMGSGPTPN